MSNWPKYNVERHIVAVGVACDECEVLCLSSDPCRCCEKARADDAEGVVKAVRRICDEAERKTPGEGFVLVNTDWIRRALDGGTE